MYSSSFCGNWEFLSTGKARERKMIISSPPHIEWVKIVWLMKNGSRGGLKAKGEEFMYIFN